MPKLAAEQAAAAGVQIPPPQSRAGSSGMSKKRCWPASKIVPTSAGRGRSGRLGRQPRIGDGPARIERKNTGDVDAA